MKNDPALLHLLSAGYTQIGDVLGLPGFANLGDRDGALAAYRKARAVIVATQRLFRRTSVRNSKISAFTSASA